MSETKILNDREAKALILYSLFQKFGEEDVSALRAMVEPYLNDTPIVLTDGMLKLAGWELRDEFSRRSTRVRGQRWSKP